MATSATFSVTPSSYGVGSVHNTKIDFGKLYLRQILAGPGMNQSDVIVPNAVTGLGQTTVNNWGIYDGVGSAAQLVAYGQGMHTMAGNWNNWFTMVFQIQRFKGSTLQIMGASLDQTNKWAIVGGTGDFDMAYGVIERVESTISGDEKLHELTIDGYCRTKLSPVPTPTTMGPWGEPGGSLIEMEGKSRRLESVTLSHNDIVYTFSFSYVNEDGQIRTSNFLGDNISYKGPKVTTIKFGPSEFVKEISGASYTGASYILAFKIITNVTTYGPFGNQVSTKNPFRAVVPVGKTAVGFFGYGSNYLNRIGLYTI